jgi:hypothetical protein
MNVYAANPDSADQNEVDVAYDIASLAGVIAGAADNIQNGDLAETAVARLAGDIRRTATLIETLMGSVIGKLEEVERAEEKALILNGRKDRT